MNMAPLELREKKKEPIRKFVHFQTTNMAAYRLLLSTLIKRTTKKHCDYLIGYHDALDCRLIKSEKTELEKHLAHHNNEEGDTYEKEVKEYRICPAVLLETRKETGQSAFAGNLSPHQIL
jgi:hypothetical protein